MMSRLWNIFQFHYTWTAIQKFYFWTIPILTWNELINNSISMQFLWPLAISKVFPFSCFFFLNKAYADFVKGCKRSIFQVNVWLDKFFVWKCFHCHMPIQLLTSLIHRSMILFIDTVNFISNAPFDQRLLPFHVLIRKDSKYCLNFLKNQSKFCKSIKTLSLIFKIKD